MGKLEISSDIDKPHKDTASSSSLSDIENTGPAADQKLQKEVLQRVDGIKLDPHHRTSRYWGNLEGSEYYLYALEGMSAHNTAESRSRQRERFQSRMNQNFGFKTLTPHIQFFRDKLDLANKFDLTILDSGVLHYQNRLLIDWKLEDAGKALSIVDIDGNEFYLRKDRKQSTSDTSTTPFMRENMMSLSHKVYLGAEELWFGYRALNEGAAIYVGEAGNNFKRLAGLDEIGSTLDRLQVLPENYLDHLNYFEENPVRISKGKMEIYDVEEESDYSSFPENASVIDMQVYSVKIGSSRIKIRIPFVDEDFMKEHSLRKNYIPTENDVSEIVSFIQRLVPQALLPSNLMLTFTPFVMTDNTYALISSSRHIVLSTTKGHGKEKWIREIILKTMLHELTHVFHSDNRMISSLLYRCMMMDGWTMEYGDTNLAEYFAVLAENFYDHPERKILFPNGYRLLFTLFKMREAGVKWTEYRNAPELLALATNSQKSDQQKSPITKSHFQPHTVKQIQTKSISRSMLVSKSLSSRFRFSAAQQSTLTLRPQIGMNTKSMSHLGLSQFHLMPTLRRFG